jgi:hypothetical protein
MAPAENYVYNYHLRDAHLAGDSRDIKIESLSRQEARYLAENLGTAGDWPETPDGANPIAIGFVREFVEATMDDDQAESLAGRLSEYADQEAVIDEETARAEEREDEAEEEEEQAGDEDEEDEDFVDSLPVSDTAKASLSDAGLLTPDDIRSAGLDGLTALPGIGKVTAEKILDALKEE